MLKIVCSILILLFMENLALAKEKTELRSYINYSYFTEEISSDFNSTTISGFVFDKRNGEALIGANVYIKDLAIGSSTNVSGFFSIPGLNNGTYTLVISYIGYKTITMDVTIPLKNQKSLRIDLESETLETNEVIVTADSVRTIDRLFVKPISKIDLGQKQINSIPRVIEADLLRALQTLPGITSLSDFSSALYVRGGTPDQNLYLIDGTDVYNPEHAFGIFSTFNTNAIKKVEISKGGFSAEYGGRLSSVLNVTNLDGNRNYFEGTANISLLSASTTLQMPIGSFGSLSGSIRRTYIDQTYSKWVKEVPDYYFIDGNLKAFMDFGENDKLSLSFFRSYDKLDFKLDKEKESFGFKYDWGNITTSANWRHIFSPELFSNFWATGSWFESNFDFQSVDFLEKNGISDAGLRYALEYYSANRFNIKFGLDYKYLRGYLRQEWSGGKVDVEETRHLMSTYASVNYKPTEKWDIEAGLRYNYFDSDVNYSNIEPRFSLKYRLSEESNIKFATGLYHQYLNRIPRLFFASIWTTSDEHARESQSQHYILGYQRSLGAVFEFEIEGYYKKYKNLYVYNQNLETVVTPQYYDEKGNPVFKSSYGLFTRGDGNSMGLEVLVRKDIGALSGWISYSYSKTEYTFDNINKGNEFAPRHDRTSVVNSVINLDLKSFIDELAGNRYRKYDTRWLIGVNFVYASGQPLTTPSSAYMVNTLPDWNRFAVTGETLPAHNLYPGEINSFRLPAYIRMDLSVTYEINYTGWTLSPYLQIFNIGNRKNIWFIDYSDEVKDGKIVQKIDKVNMLPMLPSIGVNIKF